MARPNYKRKIEQMPAKALAETLVQFDRRTLASFVEVAIGILDCADGDPEAEINNWDDEDSDPDVEYDDREQEEDLIHLYGVDQTMPLWIPGTVGALYVR